MTFFEKIESLIENDMAHLFLFCDDFRKYDCTIFRNNTKTFDDFLDKYELELEENERYHKFYYENSYSKVSAFVEINISMDRCFGCTLKVPLFKEYKKDGKNLYKVYGFFVYPDKENKVAFKQSTAHEVLEGYCFDEYTGEPVEPPADYIFCGNTTDDVICGFDLV